MPAEITFQTRTAARSFRDEYTEHLHDADDARTKTIKLREDAPEWLIDRAEAEAFIEQGAQADLPGEQVPLSDDERASLKRQHDTWNWQQHGFEAMRAKGALQAEGASEWMDFYEPGEGADGALANLRSSKGRAAETGAKVGVGGEHRERDPDDPAVLEEHARSVARAGAEECDHAEDHCRHGDPEACEFLHEACGFSEEQVDRIMAAEDGEIPGEAYGALIQLWDGYRAGLGDAKRMAAGINEVRMQVGQDPLEFEELGDRRITKETIES